MPRSAGSGQMQKPSRGGARGDAPRSVMPPPLQWKFPVQAAAELKQRVRGSVVLPGDERYHAARQAFVPNFQHFPQMVVYCDVFADVAYALAFARTWRLTPVCRAGGHSTAGHSINDDLVIDVGRLDYVCVDAPGKIAVIGAGATFGRVNAVLDSFGLHVVGGSCDDVAVAGFMLGGGYGYTSLMFGMNCDNVLQAKVMLADGRIVTASRQQEPELFWALRGGGGNVGVLLEITYRLQRLGPLWGFGIKWAAADAPEGLAALQAGFTGADVPAGLGHLGTINYDAGGVGLYVRGVYAGSRSAGLRALSALLKSRGAQMDIDRRDSYGPLRQFLDETPLVPDVPPRTRAEADSRYVDRLLSKAEWRAMLGHIEASPNRSNYIGLEPYGGRIWAVAPGASAFVHRRARFNVYSWVFWQDGEGERASLAHLDQFRLLLASCGNGRANQNYPNRRNAGYREMYWGRNCARLLAAKRRYDPGNLFAHGHVVAPSAAST